MTYTFPKDFSEPVLALCALGEDPARKREWIDYPTVLGLTEEHIPELIRIVEDIEIFMPIDEDVDEDAPEIFSSIHAWRALGQLKAGEAVPALIDLAVRNEELDIDWILSGIPMAMKMIGPIALPALEEYLNKNEQLEWANATISDSVAEIGLAYPENRMDCIKILEKRLESYEINLRYINASLIHDLTRLNATESDELIKQAFDSDNVDLSLMGDYEDYQISVGLMKKRRTPQRNYMAEEYEGIRRLREAIDDKIKADKLFDLVDPDIIKGNF